MQRLDCNFPLSAALNSPRSRTSIGFLLLATGFACACTSTVGSSGGRRPDGTAGPGNNVGNTGAGGNGALGSGGGSSSGSGSAPGTAVGGGGAVVTAPPFNGFDCPTSNPSAAAPRRLWRVNPKEYANTVAAALSGRRAAAQPLPALPTAFANPLQPGDTRYTTESGLTTVSLAEFRASFTSSADVSNQMVQSVKAGSCWATAGAAEPGFSACAGTLIQEKGSVLFRRRLAADEVTHYVQMAKDTIAEAGPDGALAVAFQSMLLAPQFVFKPEIGAATATPSVYQLDPYEVSSMLAYTLTGAPADTELWTVANSGALSTPEQIKTQVVRLMASEAPGAKNFITEYFMLRGIQGVAKSADMILAGETTTCHYNKVRLVLGAEALVSDVYQTSANGGFIKALFTNANAFVDCSSEKIFGLTGASPDTGAPMKMAAPAGQRAGFLTDPTWLGQMATRDNTKPVRRGRFVNVDVLCRDVPPVPINGVPALGDTKDLTMRERLAVHAKFDASCMPCHSLLDAPGLAFEKYDTVGAYRTMADTVPTAKVIDASGGLVGVEDASVSFTDGADLSLQISGTNRVQECVMRNGFRYFLGRQETQADQCSLKRAKDAYAPAGSYVEFISSLVTSDSFLKRSF